MQGNGRPRPAIAAPPTGDDGVTPRVWAGEEPERLFQAGVVLLEKMDRVGDALIAFKKAYELRPQETRYASYYGLCLARAKRDTRQALAICMDAIRRDFYRPELFLNLGRVYLMNRDRARAHEAFCLGLKLDRRHPRINAELKKMGVRKKPFVPFLERDHPVNRVSGRWLARLGLR